MTDGSPDDIVTDGSPDDIVTDGSPDDIVTDGSPGARRRDASVARRSAVLAGHTGDTGTARALLGDPEPLVRASALQALERGGALDDNDLRAALDDPSPAVRRRALALAITRPAVALAPLLDDPDQQVVEQAAWACGERGLSEDGTVEALSGMARGHPDLACREAAAAALGAIGDPAGRPAVVAATRDRATVRRRAVISLAAFEGPDVDEALLRAAGDRDWQVRQAAEDQLSPARPGDEASPSCGPP